MYIQSVLVFIRTFWSRASIRRAPRVVAAIVINVASKKFNSFVIFIFITLRIVLLLYIDFSACVCVYHQKA
jgi:hypothetical protein